MTVKRLSLLVCDVDLTREVRRAPQEAAATLRDPATMATRERPIDDHVLDAARSLHRLLEGRGIRDGPRIEHGNVSVESRADLAALFEAKAAGGERRHLVHSGLERK